MFCVHAILTQVAPENITAETRTHSQSGTTSNLEHYMWDLSRKSKEQESRDNKTYDVALRAISVFVT